MNMNRNYYSNLYLMTYSIDGSTYVRLKDIGNFIVSFDCETKIVIIDTIKDSFK